MKKNFFLLFIAIIATACSSLQPPAATPTGAPPNVQPTPAASATAAPLVATKDGIKIAVAAPLSGEQNTIGEGFKLGTQLAVKQLSKPLTDLGLKVQVVAFDDQGRVDQATARAKEIVADPDVLVVIGNLSSDASLAMSNVYKDVDLVMLLPSATKPQLTARGNPIVNRLFSRDDMQGPAAAHFIVEQLQLKKIYIVHDKSDFGQATALGCQDETKKIGATISGLEGTEEKTNFNATLDALKSSGADAVFFTGAYVQGANLLRQMREKNVRAAFIATERVDNPEFPRFAGPAVEGMFFETAIPFPSALPDAAQFIRDYKSEFNKDTPPFAAQAYDAVGIALKAMATLTKDGKPTRKALAQAIRATQGYKGVSGTYTFNSNGDPTLARYFFVKVTNADPRRWEDNLIFKFIELPPPQ